mgnify:CR=1 FL=1
MKTCHFTFGRFNPPTIGHEKLIKAVANAAGSGDYLIYPSQSFKKPDNPLPYDYKVEIMKKMFPWAKIESAACCNTIMKVAQDMMMKEYTDIVMVVGSDRVADFDKLLQKQNRIDYSFSTIKVISAGERDPDAAGASGMSASKMRNAAKTDQESKNTPESEFYCHSEFVGYGFALLWSVLSARPERRSARAMRSRPSAAYELTRHPVMNYRKHPKIFSELPQSTMHRGVGPAGEWGAPQHAPAPRAAGLVAHANRRACTTYREELMT